MGATPVITCVHELVQGAGHTPVGQWRAGIQEGNYENNALPRLFPHSGHPPPPASRTANPERAPKGWGGFRADCRAECWVKGWVTKWTGPWYQETRRADGRTPGLEGRPRRKPCDGETDDAPQLAWSLISSPVGQKPPYFRVNFQPTISDI